MTKPILWLGPLEDLDADYDPLLGRSASHPRLNAAPHAPKTVFDPSRSVFDDPAELEIAAQQSPAIPVVAPSVAPTLANAPANDTDTYEPTLEAAPFVETVSEAAPPHLDLAEPEPTDFTHNNDPIPERYDTMARQAASEASTGAEASDSDTQPEQGTIEHGPLEQGPLEEGLLEEGPLEQSKAATPTASKSFFTNLFSKRSIPVVAASTGAFIAKTLASDPPEPELVPTPAPVMIGDVPENIEAESAPSSGTMQGSIWDDIDNDIDNATSDVSTEITPVVVDAAPVETDASPVPEDVTIVPPESELEASADTSDAAVTQLVEASSAFETIGFAPTDPEKGQLDPASDPDADIQNPVSDAALTQTQDTALPDVLADALVDAQSDAEAEPALVDTVPASTIVAEAAPAKVPDFKGAFNADKFWSIPTTPIEVVETQPAPETEGANVLEEVQSDLSLHDNRDEDLDDDVQTTPADAGVVDTPISVAEPTIPASIPPAVAARARTAAAGRRRKRKAKKDYIGAFFGTFIFGVALLMTLVSSLAAFGYPFDMISSYRWYWIILSVVAAGIWGISRGWKMVAAAFVLMAANLSVTVPATGEAPKGGKDATAVVGWANVAGNPDALARVFKDAEKKKATLLMLAETPQSVFTPPVGWTLIEAPLAGDPTAIAVLSKSTWRAVTVPGEPTMARPPAGDLTVIGVHPQDANKRRRRTPNRDALINRAGTRAGIQEGPTIVLGDFNAAPWDKAMNQFRNYGNVTRVRCGGWAGTTLTQAFGLIGVATDHAFVRDVKVTHCQLGGPLTGGNHKPIWLYVVPQPAAPVSAPQP